MSMGEILTLARELIILPSLVYIIVEMKYIRRDVDKIAGV